MFSHRVIGTSVERITHDIPDWSEKPSGGRLADQGSAPPTNRKGKTVGNAL